MPFTMLILWGEPQNHKNDYYFRTRTRGFTKKKIAYPNIPSARRLVPQGNDYLPPVTPKIK